MKKLIAFLLTMICVFSLAGCEKNDIYNIKIIVPAGSTEGYVYSDEKISATSDKITIWASERLFGDTSVILQPISEAKETEFRGIYLTHGMPVEFDVVEGEWYKVGVAIQNPTDTDIIVYIEVEGVEVRGEFSADESPHSDTDVAGEVSLPNDGKKHVDKFYALDFLFLSWCQQAGYIPSTIDLNQMQEDYVILFGGTEDGNNIAFMDYYGIPDEAYTTYWTQKHTLASADAKTSETFNEEFKIELNFDAWFSTETIPADSSDFINPSYKYEDPVSVFIRCTTDQNHTDRYYTINGFLIEYVGEDNFNIFKDKYAGTEDFNILNFIEYFHISQEQFDSIYASENYHSLSVPYKSEYVYGSKELQELYFVKHTIYGCSQSQQPVTTEIYENQKLAFRVEFPDTWKDNYNVVANPQSLSSVIIETTWGGTLCFIFRRTTESWAESGYGELVPVEYRLLGENSDYVYLLYFASDVQYDPEDDEQVNTYEVMREDLYNIKFEILHEE